MSNLSQIKEYKVLKAKKQAKKMSEAFQIKSINLIKKFNIEKENKEFKLPREVSDNVQFPKNRKNELKMGKPEKPRFSNLKKECANLCVTTTPFFKKTLTS